MTPSPSATPAADWTRHGFTAEDIAAAVRCAVSRYLNDHGGIDREELTQDTCEAVLRTLSSHADQIHSLDGLALRIVKRRGSQRYSGTSRGPDIAAQIALADIINHWPLRRPSILSPDDEAYLRERADHVSLDELAAQLRARWAGPQVPTANFHRIAGARRMLSMEQVLEHGQWSAVADSTSDPASRPTIDEHVEDLIVGCEQHRFGDGQTCSPRRPIRREHAHTALVQYLRALGLPELGRSSFATRRLAASQVNAAGGPSAVARTILDGQVSVDILEAFASPWCGNITLHQIEAFAEVVVSGGDRAWLWLSR